jgi:hypothetical protein
MEPDSFVRARPCAPKLIRWAAGERLRSRLDFALLPWHALRYQVRPELELLRFCLTSIRTGRVSRPGIILLASLTALSWKQAARQQETKMRESPSICTRLRLEACQRAMPCFREGGFEPGMVGGQALSWPKPRRRIAGCWSLAAWSHAAGSICRRQRSETTGGVRLVQLVSQQTTMDHNTSAAAERSR